MIDKQAFAAGLGLLAANFNKTVDPALSRVWYGTISARLTTAEFERAVTMSIAEDTFWPTAAQLIGKVAPPSAEQQGHEALEHVNHVTSSVGGFRFLSHETFWKEFDAPTRAAISACGGLYDMANCSVEKYGAMQRKFAAAYAKALEPVKALPATGTDGRVAGLIKGTVQKLSLVPDYKSRAAGEGHDDE
jgi:hypothetical protein